MNLEKTLKNVGKVFAGIVLATALTFCQNGTTTKENEDNDEPKTQQSAPTMPTLLVTPESYEPNRWMKLTVQDNSNDEEGFKIERRKYDESQFVEITTLKNGITFDDKKNIIKSISYEYRIQAFNSYGASDWSYKTATSVGTQTGSKAVYAIVDTFVIDGSTANYGSENCVEMGAQPNNGKDTRSLLKFSLPTIPSYSIGYKGANLHLNDASGKHNSYTVPMEIYAYANTNPWDENSVTYNSRPGTWVTDYGYVIKGADDSLNHVYDVDINISNMVSAWFGGKYPNYGLTLHMPKTNNFWNFYSREIYPELGCASIRVDYEW